MGVETTTLAALDAFADDTATLDGTAVSVVVDLDVDIVDGTGNIRRYAAAISTRKANFPQWSEGDYLTTSVGNFRLRELAADDGFVLIISATKAT